MLSGASIHGTRCPPILEKSRNVLSSLYAFGWFQPLKYRPDCSNTQHYLEYCKHFECPHLLLLHILRLCVCDPGMLYVLRMPHIRKHLTALTLIIAIGHSSQKECGSPCLHNSSSHLRRGMAEDSRISAKARKHQIWCTHQSVAPHLQTTPSPRANSNRRCSEQGLQRLPPHPANQR